MLTLSFSTGLIFGFGWGWLQHKRWCRKHPTEIIIGGDIIKDPNQTYAIWIGKPSNVTLNVTGEIVLFQDDRPDHVKEWMGAN